jgi:hypothetical protein
MSDVEFSVGQWTAGKLFNQLILFPSHCDLAEWFHWSPTNDPRMFNIPLIVNTEGQFLSILRQCKKFLKDLPQDVSIARALPLSASSLPLSTFTRDLTPKVPCKKGVNKAPQASHQDQGPPLPKLTCGV